MFAPTNKKKVFVDTSALSAAFDNKDPNHKKVKLLFHSLLKDGYSFVITNFIIAETHALLLKNANPKIARTWLDSAYSNFNIARPQKEDELEAKAKINKYNDKDFSMTDMLSFLSMKKLDIQYYLAFDRHFQQMGSFTNVQNAIDKN